MVYRGQPDALGSEYTYKGAYKLTGTVGDIGTSSFIRHIILLWEGGEVYTSNPLLAKILPMRDWGGLYLPRCDRYPRTAMTAYMVSCHGDMTINMFILISVII